MRISILFLLFFLFPSAALSQTGTHCSSITRVTNGDVGTVHVFYGDCFRSTTSWYGWKCFDITRNPEYNYIRLVSSTVTVTFGHPDIPEGSGTFSWSGEDVILDHSIYIPGDNGVSGTMCFEVSCNSPGCDLPLSPCSQPTPIDFPLCKGGTGQYSYQTNADFLMSYDQPDEWPTQIPGGWNYTYSDRIMTIYEYDREVTVQSGSIHTRPDGSTCKVGGVSGNQNNMYKFVICPQGNADQPEEPSSSSSDPSSSSPASISSASSNSSSSASDLCSTAPWLPWCPKSSASATPSSASGAGDDWCDIYPGSLLCEGYGSSNSGNDGGCDGPDCEPGDPDGGCTGPGCADGTEPGGGSSGSGSGSGPGSGGPGGGGYPEGHCDGVMGLIRSIFTDDCGGNVSGDPGGWCDPEKEDCGANIDGGDTTWGVTRTQWDSALVAYGLDTASFKRSVDSLLKDTAFVFKSMRTAMEPFTACFGDAGSGSGILDFSFKSEVSGIECGDACRIDLHNFMGVDVADILNVLITFLLSTAAAVRIIRVAKTLGQTG